KDFGPHLDDFPILVLSLSLHCLAKSPALYDSGIDGDALLFRRDDYVSLLTCKHIPFFIKQQGDEVINARFGLLQYSLSQTVIELKSLPEVLRSTAYVYKELSTEEEDDGGAWFDKYGVKYSADKRKLLKAPEQLSGKYHILDGAEVVCDGAFSECYSLESISIPDSVTTIGNKAFYNCSGLESITLPDSVTTIGNSAFSGCSGLQSIMIPDSVTTIGYYAFEDCNSLQSIKIPKGSKKLKELLINIGIKESIIKEI
ncbi:MAG: leucine-rich repeat domain-containing protein, partial [Phocaeicola sp.]